MALFLRAAKYPAAVMYLDLPDVEVGVAADEEAEEDLRGTGGVRVFIPPSPFGSLVKRKDSLIFKASFQTPQTTAICNSW